MPNLEQETSLPALSRQYDTPMADARCPSAIGYRLPGRDRVTVRGVEEIQRRPGAQYED